MKRKSNGLVIGTVIVLLVTGLIVAQQFTSTFDEGHEQGLDEQADTHVHPGQTPTLEQLRSMVRGTGQGPSISRPAPSNPGLRPL